MHPQLAKFQSDAAEQSKNLTKMQAEQKALNKRLLDSAAAYSEKRYPSRTLSDLSSEHATSNSLVESHKSTSDEVLADQLPPVVSTEAIPHAEPVEQSEVAAAGPRAEDAPVELDEPLPMLNGIPHPVDAVQPSPEKHPVNQLPPVVSTEAIPHAEPAEQSEVAAAGPRAEDAPVELDEPLPMLNGIPHPLDAVQPSREKHPSGSKLAELQRVRNECLATVKNYARLGLFKQQHAEEILSQIGIYRDLAFATPDTSSSTFLEAAESVERLNSELSSKNAEIAEMLITDRSNRSAFAAADAAYAKARGVEAQSLPKRSPRTILEGAASEDEVNRIAMLYADAKRRIANESQAAEMSTDLAESTATETFEVPKHVPSANYEQQSGDTVLESLDSPRDSDVSLNDRDVSPSDRDVSSINNNVSSNDSDASSSDRNVETSPAPRSSLPDSTLRTRFGGYTVEKTLEEKSKSERRDRVNSVPMSDERSAVAMPVATPLRVTIGKQRRSLQRRDSSQAETKPLGGLAAGLTIQAEKRVAKEQWTLKGPLAKTVWPPQAPDSD